MRHFRSSALGFILSLCIAFTGTTVAKQLTVTHGCSDNVFCQYQNITYGAGRWQTSFNNIHASVSGGVSSCLNVAPATWSNGTPVADNTSGFVINGLNSAPWNLYWIIVYNWVNCNPSGQYSLFDTVGPGLIPNYSSWNYFTNNPTNISLYHTVTSVGLIPRS